MGKQHIQVKLTESAILEAIDDVLSEYEDGTPSWYGDFMNPEYSDKPEDMPDYNDNVHDYSTVRYGMLAQDDDEFSQRLGKTKRPTKRETGDEIERYVRQMLEAKLDTLINEAISDFVHQDTDDEDSDLFDTGLYEEPRYRVKWCIKRHDYRTDEYVTVSEENILCQTKDEAKALYDKVKEKYKGYYALYITIEKEVDTLTGKRWEYVLHLDGKTL